MSKRAIITGITGQDGSYLAELLLDQGYEVTGIVRRLSHPNFERIAHLLDRIKLRPADLLDELSLIRAIEENEPDEFYNLAAMSFVPASWDQPLLTGEFNAPGCDARARRSAARQSEDPVLPGLVERDVRQGARGAADRDDAVLPAQPVRRVEGVRALHHRQLPRELRPVAVLGHPVQPRVAAARPRVRHAQGDATAWPASSSGSSGNSTSATSKRTATGASPATTSARCGSCCSSRRPTTTSWRPARAIRCATSSRSRSATSASTGSSTSRSIPGLLRPAEVDHLIGNAAKARQILGWAPSVDFAGLIEHDGRERHRTAVRDEAIEAPLEVAYESARSRQEQGLHRRHHRPGVRRSAAGGGTGPRAVPRHRVRRRRLEGGRTERRAQLHPGREGRGPGEGGGVRSLQGDHRHVRPGGDGLHRHRRADAAAQNEGPRHVLRRPGGGGGPEAPQEGPARQPRVDHLPGHDRRARQADAGGDRAQGRRRLLPRLLA